MLERKREHIQDQFKAELRNLRTKGLDRKQKILDKRDKILSGELTGDQILEFDAPYSSTFSQVEQIAQNIVRLPDEKEDLLKSKKSDKEDSESEEDSESQTNTINTVSGMSKNRAPTPDNASATSKMKFGSQKKSVAESVKKSATQASMKSSQQPNKRTNT